MIVTHEVELTGFEVTVGGQVNIEYRIDGGALRSRTFASVDAYNAEAEDFLDNPEFNLRLLMAFLNQRGERIASLAAAIGQKVTIEYETTVGALLTAHTLALKRWLVSRHT